MFKANEDIRTEAKKAKIPLWRIADAMGYSEPTITRKLRKELTPGEKEPFKNAIMRIKEEQKCKTE